LDNAPIGISIVDRNRKILEANKATGESKQAFHLRNLLKNFIRNEDTFVQMAQSCLKMSFQAH